LKRSTVIISINIHINIIIRMIIVIIIVIVIILITIIATIMIASCVRLQLCFRQVVASLVANAKRSAALAEQMFKTMKRA